MFLNKLSPDIPITEYTAVDSGDPKMLINPQIRTNVITNLYNRLQTAKYT